MKDKLDSVSFTLTPGMSEELIKFNNLKKQLVTLKRKHDLKENDLIKIKELENELNKTRKNFINEFRNNNKEEIIKYINLKDQI